MKIGTFVSNHYQGIMRYGKVNNVFKGEDGWSWCEVGWIGDDQYQEAIQNRNNISNKDHNKTFYRVDELNQIDLNKTIETLLKLQNIAE